ncbi:MAG: Maf family nucleotide pyrophosphatase [Cellulomonadaceae bacterium]|jgi:septum formation protein|nr:Maf family nucleotide pyrophosphatase [Cellulomonadaceae bacterium]
MPGIDVILASASPARLSTLRAAGVEPTVVVSGVDEDATLAAAMERFGDLDAADSVLVLAQAKAEDVARQVEAGTPSPTTTSTSSIDSANVIVVGCDSMLEFQGQMLGKPATAEIATERWKAMRGNSGTLHTGHWIIDLREDGTGGTLGATSSCTVYFADIDDDEIAAYVATGEPLHVAGAFTVDGLGGPYIEKIDGDYHGVVGLSLPLFRELLAQIDVPFSALREPGNIA